MRHQSLALGLILALPTVIAIAKPNAILFPIVSSREMIWNAIATDQDRIFVAGPRWTGGKGPAVAVFDRKGHPQPYPNNAWNSWTPGADAGRAFVSVNALHRDDHGGLWVIDTGAPSFGGDAVPGGAKAIRIKLATNRVDRIYPLGPQVVLSGSYIDDIRFHGDHAYLTDAGRPGLIVLDLTTGARSPDHCGWQGRDGAGRLAAARQQRSPRSVPRRTLALLWAARRPMVEDRDPVARRSLDRARGAGNKSRAVDGPAADRRHRDGRERRPLFQRPCRNQS
jgi:hypothetical protein